MAAFIRLVLTSGPTAGKEFPLEKPENFIGRDLGNDVVINDPEVSRRHARVYLQGNAYIIEDLGSTNGTSVNGQHLTGPYMLRAGEQITFGERVNLAVEAMPKPAEPPAAKPVFQPAEFQPAPVPRQPSYPPVNPAPQPPAYQPPAQAQSYPPPQPAYPYQASYPQQQPAAYPDPNAYPAAQPHDAQAQSQFSGQVPFPPYVDEPTPPVEYRIPVWMFVVIGVLVLTIVVLLIDDFHLWCPLFGLC
jgi:pSer/pThr/pTyr-binding forkhead associated (FHA) protein